MEKLSKQGKSLKNFSYTDKEIANEIYSAINSTQFLGVSVRDSAKSRNNMRSPLFQVAPIFNRSSYVLQGYVAFSSQGDRIALTQIEQMIDGKYVKLGYYDTQSDNLTWRNMERWIGGKVPQDRTIVKTVLRTVSLPLFICMGTISSLGIIIAVALIIFNIWNRHRRYIIYIYIHIKYKIIIMLHIYISRI